MAENESVGLQVSTQGKWEQLRKAAEAASGGSWNAAPFEHANHATGKWEGANENDWLVHTDKFCVAGDIHCDDANYIAAANPVAVTELLDERDELAKQVEALKQGGNSEITRLRERVGELEKVAQNAADTLEDTFTVLSGPDGYQSEALTALRSVLSQADPVKPVVGDGELLAAAKDAVAKRTMSFPMRRAAFKRLEAAISQHEGGR